MFAQLNHRKPIAVICATSLALCGLGMVGCAGTVATSSNDKYVVFQDDEDNTFSPADTSEASSKQGTEVAITASGWWAKDCYIHYGIKVKNSNTDLIARDVVIQITSYDEAGNQLSQDQATISFIGPETETGFAGKCGNGQKPDRVDIEVVGTTTWQDAGTYNQPLFVASVEEIDKGYYRYEYTGGITNNTGEYVSTVPISILLEDEDGNIIAGYAGSTKRLKAGRTKSYQITINTAPDHAQVEVFAQWSTVNDDVNDELADDEGEDEDEA